MVAAFYITDLVYSLIFLMTYKNFTAFLSEIILKNYFKVIKKIDKRSKNTKI